MVLLPAGVSVLALLLLKFFGWLFGFPVYAPNRFLALVRLTSNFLCMCRASSCFFPLGAVLCSPCYLVPVSPSLFWSLMVTFGLLGSSSLSHVLCLSLLLLEVEGLPVVG